MTVLPALLYILDKPLEKTVFKKRVKKKRVKQQTIFARISAYLDALKNVPLPAGSAPPPLEIEDDGKEEKAEQAEQEVEKEADGNEKEQ